MIKIKFKKLNKNNFDPPLGATIITLAEIFYGQKNFGSEHYNNKK